MENLIKTLYLSIALLAGCGGAPATAQPFKIYAQPSDRTILTQGYDTQMRIKMDGMPLLSAAQEVAEQAALGPSVILTIGGRSQAVIDRFPALIAEARKYNNFEWVYLYDELCWGPGGLGAPCQHEAEVYAGATMARANGYKTLVTIMPDVILHPSFNLANINAFDGIAIDVYPSIRVSNNTYGCSYGSNLYENLLRCSIAKLRAQGFAGQIGYIWQAFALSTESLETGLQHAQDQRHVINNAASYGVSAVMPWGLYLGAYEQALDPTIVPLGGTLYEHLVSP